VKKVKELASNRSFQEWLEQHKELVQQQLESHKDEMTPEQFLKLDEAVNRLGQSARNRSSGDPSTAEPQASQNAVSPEGNVSGPKAENGQTSPRGMGQPQGIPSTPPTEESTPDQSLRRWIVDNFNPSTGPLSQSPAFQNALRELRRTPITTEPPAADANGWAGRFARWSESLAKNQNWPKVNWPSTSKWRLPSTRSLPKIQSPIKTPSFGPMPNVNMPPASALERGLQLLWVALIFVAGILLWKLLGGSMSVAGRRGKFIWKLGAWPVAPGAVATRQDVIQAFEYLSLLRLGPTAQSRNHLELAVGLGQAATDHRQSAERLAAVYEQARYTPENEPLSIDALAAARSELCYLAGVKNA
jgi:hypothetical protein